MNINATAMGKLLYKLAEMLTRMDSEFTYLLVGVPNDPDREPAAIVSNIPMDVMQSLLAQSVTAYNSFLENEAAASDSNAPTSPHLH